jgi:hypothetical protein
MSLSSYSPAQLQVARDTLSVLRLLGVPKGSRIDLACVVTQIVESSLLGPIWRGDNPVTKGAYQQKDAWVPPYVLNDWMDPRRTLAGGTSLFLYGGYAGQPGMFAQRWYDQAIPIGAVIQHVQGSAFPQAYINATPDGVAILAAIS